MIELFKALADDNRLRILHLVATGYFCVCELEVLLEMNQSNVSRHLNKLKSAGMITPIKDGLWVHYKLSEAFCENNEALLVYLKYSWACQEPYLADLQRYKRYRAAGLSCKEITESKELVLTALQSKE